MRNFDALKISYLLNAVIETPLARTERKERRIKATRREKKKRGGIISRSGNARAHAQQRESKREPIVADKVAIGPKGPRVSRARVRSIFGLAHSARDLPSLSLDDAFPSLWVLGAYIRVRVYTRLFLPSLAFLLSSFSVASAASSCIVCLPTYLPSNQRWTTFVTLTQMSFFLFISVAVKVGCHKIDFDFFLIRLSLNLIGPIFRSCDDYL